MEARRRRCLASRPDERSQLKVDASEFVRTRGTLEHRSMHNVVAPDYTYGHSEHLAIPPERCRTCAN